VSFKPATTLAAEAVQLHLQIGERRGAGYKIPERGRKET
jgi:hypothetical protein